MLREEVDEWISEARENGIQSIICLLADEHLNLYADLPAGLVNYYRRSGLAVEPIPVPDLQDPPMPPDKLERAYEAYEQLLKPVLVHCSAGVDRTGATVKYIKRQLAKKASEARGHR